jgi:cysteinyl-tRNA synthetase
VPGKRITGRYSDGVPKRCAALLSAILVMAGTIPACVSGERTEKGGSSPVNSNARTGHGSAVETGVPSSGATPAGIRDVTSWLYQLDGYPGGRLDAVAASPHRLAVVDLARDAAGGYFTRAEIERVRHSGKRVLAYFEIGAIERYRPEYRAVVDRGLVLNRWADWPEEYFVRYWDPAWWDLVVRPRVDRAIRAGFDGVYLDAPVAYEEIDTGLVPGSSRRALARRMVKLVIQVSGYAKSVRPGFWVFPQNSPELAEFPGYFPAIDGIGVEELFFRASGAETDLPCDAGWCAENLVVVRRLRDAGKLVLAVDYANRPDNIRTACRRYHEERFVGYVTVPTLDRVQPRCQGG